MTQLYCPIRKAWFNALPEEQVRQALLSRLILQLGYPIGLIAVEKSLTQLPHLATKSLVPKRRMDIIVYGKGTDGALFPVLVIECKAVALTEKVLRQVVGYNHFVEAPFIGVANETSVVLACWNASRGNFSFESGLPDYQTLMNRARQE